MIQPLNSPLEVGLRALFVLADQYPATLELEELSILDHYLLHSGHGRGVQTILPDLPDSVSELALKRGLMRDGLHLMQALGLAKAILTPTGLKFSATESTAGFLDLLTEDLATVFRGAAHSLSASVVPRLREDSPSMAALLSTWRRETAEQGPGPDWGSP